MSTIKLEEKDFAVVEPKIGQTYPLVGVITKIISEEPEDLVFEINYNIHIHVHGNKENYFDTIKSRLFESGIFIAEIVDLKDGIYYAMAKTVILSIHRPNTH